MNHEQIRIATDASPLVVVDEARGDLRVSAWSANEVMLEVESTELASVEEREGAVHILLSDDGRLHLPLAARLRIKQVRGDLRVRALKGELTIDEVAGDLSLRDVGPAQVTKVHGDLAVRGAAGDVVLHAVAGDASVRDVAGDLTAEAIGADLVVRQLAGSLAATAGADASLSLDPQPGHDYHVRAGGAITCRLPEQASADLEITSGARAVVVRLATGQAPRSEEGSYRLTLGEGGPKVRLEAGGKVVLTAGAPVEFDHQAMADLGARFAEEFSSMADHIAREIGARTENMMAEISVRLSNLSETLPEVLEAAGLSSAEADRIAARVRRSSERAAERAAEKARRRAEAAARRAEREMARARRRAERQAQRMARIRLRRHGAPSAPPHHPVTEDERMAILRMLEEGKITAEQAQELFKALEGRS